MKRIHFLIGLSLLMIIAYICNENYRSTNFDFRDFAVEDTASITKIYFADRQNNEVLLEKINGKWKVDGDQDVRDDAIQFLLSTIKDIQIKNPVGKQLHNKIVKSTATIGVKVEIYTSDPKIPFKTYYIGGEPADMIGNYMIMKKSTTSYVVYLPGFKGFLSPRYNIDGRRVSNDLWRNRTIFKSSPQSISFEFHEDPEKNYTLNFQTKELIHKNTILKTDTIKVEQYAKLIQKINCESYANHFEKIDSITRSKSLYSMTLNFANDSVKKFSTWRMPAKRDTYIDPDGKPIIYDVDRMYGYYNNQFMIVQYYVFDKIMKEHEGFLVEK